MYSRLIAIAMVCVAVIVFASVQYAGRDQVRSGVSALGVNLSGMTRDEALAAVSAAATERLTTPLQLSDDGRQWTVTAADLGLAIDVDGIVDDAYGSGRSGLGADRLALLWHLRDDGPNIGTDRIAIEGGLLDAKLQSLATAIFQQRVDPQLGVDPGGIRWTPPRIGKSLDIEASRQAIVASLASGESVAELAVVVDAPPTYFEDYAQVRHQLNQLWDQPIELAAAGETWTLSPDLVSNQLTIVQPQDGQPARLEVNEGWVDEVIWQISVATDQSPQSPRIWWGEGGGLVVTREGAPGYDLDEDGARAMIRAAVLGENSANRIDLPVAEVRSPALPADLNQLGIQTLLTTASTSYGGGLAERMYNIEFAANLLNGVVIMPGQTFSFNAEIGPMTLDAGFKMGYAVAETAEGVTTIPAEAGGICQVATTVFQPIFWGGYQVDQRGTHSYWIPRYVSNGYVGLDAAVEPAVGLDFKWTNNSSSAVMLEVVANGQDLVVNLYGTPPDWRVEADTPAVSDRVPADPEIVYQATDTLPDGQMRQVENAQDGFNVVITRRVIQGENVASETFTGSYVPARNMVLVGSSTGELPPGYN